MKILILSNSHPYRTAGIVAKDFMDGLKEIDGNEVKLVVRVWDNYQDKNIIPIDGFFKHNQKRIFRKGINSLKRLGFFRKEIIKTNEDYSVQDFDQTITYYPTKKILKKAAFEPDVIIVLFMSNFLSFKNLYELNKHTKAPILLRLQDMAALTGGCHYAWNCKGYLDKCGKCPALYSNDPFDQSNINWTYKKRYVEKTGIKIITGSEWLYKKIQESSIFTNKEKYKIPLPIDENIFRPALKKEVRSFLNLPENKKIIFFGATSIFDKRKGLKQLTEALHILKLKLNDDDSNLIHLAIAGKSNEKLAAHFPFPFTYLGYLSYDMLPKAFQAADVFVCPSIEDSGPMMINQSIMCGTPVVSFEMGVALDLINTGKTGYRAKLYDTEDLANGILYVLRMNAEIYNKISANCRELAMNNNSIEIVLRKLEKVLMGNV